MISRFNVLTHVWIIDEYMNIYYVKVIKLKVNELKSWTFIFRNETYASSASSSVCLLLLGQSTIDNVYIEFIFKLTLVLIIINSYIIILLYW